jgi:hypothetical protein
MDNKLSHNVYTENAFKTSLSLKMNNHNQRTVSKGVAFKLLVFFVFHFEGLNILASLHYEHQLSLI